MEVAGIVVNQVTVMFLLLAVGIAVFKIGLVTAEAARMFCGFLMKVVTPCVLIDAYRQPFTSEKAMQLLLAFGLAAGYHLLAVLLSGLLYKKNQTEVGIKRLGVVYSNCGFMGSRL